MRALLSTKLAEIGYVTTTHNICEAQRGAAGMNFESFWSASSAENEMLDGSKVWVSGFQLCQQKGKLII